ncbi:MAG: ATP-binding protein [Tannerellaceae bacterium]|jgi:predicted AAA+ superfamily ATPase|nr:ATP-binding protein [Tannerellaceae bacterium]
MDINEYVRIVADQKEEMKLINPKELCSRKEEALFDLDSHLAQIVIGVRRSGKSTICHKVLKEKDIPYAYINFDDERLYKLQGRDLDTLLEAAYMVYGDFHYLFLDEIQNIEEWFLFVNRLLRQKIHLVITGSNARLLSGELSSHLTGRYNQIELYPFSFAEFCQYRKVDTRDMSTKGAAFKKAAFEAFYQKGGFPELSEVKNSRGYVQGLFDSIIRKDIQQRFKVRYIEALRMLANHLIDHFGQEIIYSDLAGRFGFGSLHTAENYVSYLKQSYLLLGIHKFSFKSKARIRNEKGYVVDVAFISEREDAMNGQNRGWKLENMVYVELLRRNKPLFRDIFYYREQYEIDFVICDGNRVKELIQVSADISSAKTYNREVTALYKAAGELSCENLTLITMNENRTVSNEKHTIKIRPIIDWLLQEEE